MLIVDDDQAIREAVRSLLEQEGIAVHLAADAYEASRELGRRSFDAVVTDLRMPGGGESVLRCARSVQPWTPVIVMSSQVDRNHLDQIARNHEVFASIDKLNAASRLLPILWRAFARRAAEPH